MCMTIYETWKKEFPTDIDFLCILGWKIFPNLYDFFSFYQNVQLL